MMPLSAYIEGNMAPVETAVELQVLFSVFSNCHSITTGFQCTISQYQFQPAGSERLPMCGTGTCWLFASAHSPPLRPTLWDQCQITSDSHRCSRRWPGTANTTEAHKWRRENWSILLFYAVLGLLKYSWTIGRKSAASPCFHSSCLAYWERKSGRHLESRETILLLSRKACA